MFCLRLAITLWFAAAFCLMKADSSTAQSGHYGVTTFFAEKVTTCDDPHNVQRLSCDNGVIMVQSALYGRADRDTCSEGRPHRQLDNVGCSQQGTVDVLKTRCDGKRVCEINTNLVRTSDPCFGTYKYLETTYNCYPAIHSVTCDNSVAHLHCDRGHEIFVYAAHYGRQDQTTCSLQRHKSQIQNVGCSARASQVAERCNGKSSCTIKASNSVFGEPCLGTYKYLEVAYICQHRHHA